MPPGLCGQESPKQPQGPCGGEWVKEQMTGQFGACWVPEDQSWLVMVLEGASEGGRPGRRRVARIIHGSVKCWWILTSWNSGRKRTTERGLREREGEREQQGQKDGIQISHCCRGLGIGRDVIGAARGGGVVTLLEGSRKFSLPQPEMLTPSTHRLDFAPAA